MSSRRNGDSSTISPVLFLNVSGEPMRFYLRPGPTKVQLLPVIQAGGGVICRAQDPSAILLADPEDIASASASTAHFYVSTQYIRDCVEKKEQLELEDYRFNTERVQTRASRQRREGGSGGGRMGYTSEEDSAILDYISEHERESRGNRVWQDMEKKLVTNHSWQSMKDRYRKHLSHRTAKAGSEKRRDTPKRHTPKASPSQNPPASPEPLPESDSPETKPRTEHSEPAPELEIPEQEPGPEVPEPPPEPDVLKPAPSSDPPKTASEEELTAPDPADLPQASTEPPTELSVESQLPCSLQPLGVPEGEDSPSKQQRRAGRPRRPSGPSSSTPVAKRARAGSPAARDDTEKEESTSSGVNAGPFIQRQTEPQRRKKTSKTKNLGILEKASREFEESGESEDETPDLEEGRAACPPEASATGRVTQDPAPVPQTESPDESASVDTEPQPNLQGRSPEAQGPSEADPTEVAAPGPGPGPGEPLLSTSGAHLFLFDSESQEVETSQPIRDEVPFTQLQVEETKRLIKGLMKRTNKDLVEVTKALLKTSGDLSEALLCLTNGKGAEPFWDYRDDELLLSADPSELHEKYGEKGVAKRLAFLDTE